MPKRLIINQITQSGQTIEVNSGSFSGFRVGDILRVYQDQGPLKLELGESLDFKILGVMEVKKVFPHQSIWQILKKVEINKEILKKGTKIIVFKVQDYAKTIELEKFQRRLKVLGLKNENKNLDEKSFDFMENDGADSFPLKPPFDEYDNTVMSPIVPYHSQLPEFNFPVEIIDEARFRAHQKFYKVEIMKRGPTQKEWEQNQLSKDLKFKINNYFEGENNFAEKGEVPFAKLLLNSDANYFDTLNEKRELRYQHYLKTQNLSSREKQKLSDREMREFIEEKIEFENKERELETLKSMAPWNFGIFNGNDQENQIIMTSLSIPLIKILSVESPISLVGRLSLKNESQNLKMGINYFPYGYSQSYEDLAPYFGIMAGYAKLDTTVIAKNNFYPSATIQTGIQWRWLNYLGSSVEVSYETWINYKNFLSGYLGLDLFL